MGDRVLEFKVCWLQCRDTYGKRIRDRPENQGNSPLSVTGMACMVPEAGADQLKSAQLTIDYLQGLDEPPSSNFHPIFNYVSSTDFYTDGDGWISLDRVVKVEPIKASSTLN